ncbi:GNAT family N-acetyltransferase [Flavobacteriaceae bacterium SZ-1-7]|uniref:GNAT family N-acetyltransferase n=1 Tax=Tamlana sedimenti TaxID=3134126 RepID=UPI0031241619
MDTTFHLGIFSKEKLLGVCSFFKANNANIPESSQYQLRGMAVLNEFQGKGLGHHILNFGEQIIKKKNTKIVWCNAREVAVNFYRKNGYRITGEPFIIETIGLHFVMYKML